MDKLQESPGKDKQGRVICFLSNLRAETDVLGCSMSEMTCASAINTEDRRACTFRSGCAKSLVSGSLGGWDEISKATESLGLDKRWSFFCGEKGDSRRDRSKGSVQRWSLSVIWWSCCVTRDVEPGYQGGGDVWSRALVGDNGREAGLLAMNEADKLKGSNDDLGCLW